jgi:hypothetical protein
VRETNRQGKTILRDSWRFIDEEEMLAFFGLLILRGVYTASGEATDNLWSATDGRPVFAKTMSFTRFKQIRRFLRFDNPATRAGRQIRDKLAAVRLLIDGFLSNSMKAYVPGINVTVDEQLYPFRGRCAYRQYMPSKPAKYGLKFWLLCDSDDYYCYNMMMYTGSEPNQGDRSFGEFITMTLSEPLCGSGRNITTDNYFTSLSLARSLLQKQMTLVGTIRLNKRELPQNVTAKQELFSSRFLFTAVDGISLAIYRYE